MNLYAYAWKNFRQKMNKGIVFMIALAVLLMSAVLHVAVSFQQTLYNSILDQNTNAHAMFSHLSKEQLDEFPEDESVLWKAKLINTSVWGSIPGTNDGMNLSYISNMKDIHRYRLIDGKEPVEEHEAVVTNEIAKLLGIKAEQGEVFTLSIEGRLTDFTVTGVMEEDFFASEKRNYILYVSLPMIGNYDTKEDLYFISNHCYVHFKEKSDVEEKSRVIEEKLELDHENVYLNEIYLEAQELNPEMLAIAAVVLLILLATGAVVIYNAFHIIVVKRVQQLGMLTLIGASKRQIRHSVYLEALIAGGVGLPIGLLGGMGLSYVCIPLLRQILEYDNLRFYTSPWIFLLVLVLTSVMILAGTMRPAKKAASITPVEAVKLAPITEKEMHREEKDFLTIPVLGKLNMQRNRGRSFSTILALSISGVLLLSISSVGISLYDSVDSMIEEQMDDDIMVETGRREGTSYFSPEMDQLTEDLLERMRAIDGVNRVEAFSNQEYYNETSYTEYSEQEEKGFGIERGVVIGMDKETQSRLLEKFSIVGSSEAEPAEDGLIPVIAIDRTLTCPTAYGYKLGDVVQIYPQRYDSSGNYTRSGGVKVRISGIISEKDFPNLSNWGLGGNLPNLLLPQELYNTLGFNNSYQVATIDIENEKHDSIIAELEKICEPYEEIELSSTQELKRKMKDQVLGILSLVFLAVCMIGVIGILNLASTIYTGIEQRRQEFEILFALGLSVKGLRRLLRYENMRICGYSLLFSAAGGIGTGLLLCWLVSMSGAGYMAFSFPWIPLLALSSIYTAVPFFLILIPLKNH